MSDAIPREYRIRISEIYPSIQGESLRAGELCVFVRLTGCPLRCRWCDSTFTFHGGTPRDWREVAREAHDYGIPMVEITGGEPLIQPTVIPLMEQLLTWGHEVLLETSGAISVEPVPDGVHIVCDFKAPGSGEEAKNDWSNLEHLKPTDEIKLVLAHREDYLWARRQIRQYDLARRVAAVQLSPVWGELDPADLAAWMVEDRLPARLQLQLHKVVWSPDARGV